jgi:antitoxin component HigA of HigAB toxin-antitoxin module
MEGTVLTMATTTRKSSAPDNYFQLVRAFPLRRLRNASDHARATRVYLQLSRQKADKGRREYMEVLVDLIAEYEKRSHQIIDASGVSAADLISHLLQERDMSVSALARDAGIPQPNLSEMLKGNREWSKTAIRALSKLLNISVERFLI